jgi:hypothetical protein
MNTNLKTSYRRSPRPGLFASLSFVLGLLSCVLSVQAQWEEVSYNLMDSGWHAIFLHGDASHDSIGNLLPTEVTEVWRWEPDPSEVQFTSTPLLPSSGGQDWGVWTRVDEGEMKLIGQFAYLIKTSAATSFTLKQKPVPPSSIWVRSGANLLGFPSNATSGFPTFANYFNTFPAATQANTTIYKYIGGEFGANNPRQIQPPTFEAVDRNQAYWFSSKVVGDFYGPLDIDLNNPAGLLFGRSGSVITVSIRNRSASSVIVQLAEDGSLTAPGSEAAIPAVPLTRLFFNGSTLAYEPAPITGANDTVQIDPNSTVEVKFGINRAHASMNGAADDTEFASILRITDSGNLMDVSLPVSAQKGSLAGLWVGDIELSSVGSRVSNGAQGIATVVDGVITAIEVSGTGGFGYSAESAPAVTIAVPAEGGVQATATATVENGKVSEFTITNGGSGYQIDAPAVAVAPPAALTGTSTPRDFPLRTLLHIADDGPKTTTLLSQVFIGQLAAEPNDLGLTTLESLLKQDAKASAQRLVAAHMPLDQAITSGSGPVAVPGTLIRTITVPFDDPTNPFVHQYHPDHDNKDGSLPPQALEAGVESYEITRTCTFTFTAAPPAGSSADVVSWGSTVIGGTYTESIAGIHKNPIELGGIFELRRASEIGTLIKE